MLTRLTVVIILQYIHILNLVVHLKLTCYCTSAIPQFKKKNFFKTVTEGEDLKVLTETNEYVLTMWVYGYAVN